jgi:hypothetical protein
MNRNPEYEIPQKAEPEKVTPEPPPVNPEAGTEHLQDVLKTYEEQYR